MPFPAGLQGKPGFCNRHAEPDRGQRVLQRAASARVHVHVAAGHARQSRLPAEFLECGKAFAVAASRQQFDGDPEAAGKALREPQHVGSLRLCRWQPERKAMRDACFKMITREAIFTLRRIAPALRDQLGQVAVTLPIGREQHEAQAILEPELGADDQLEWVFTFFAGRLFLFRMLFGCRVRAHDAGERAFVGDCQRLVTAPDRGLDQFLRVRSAAQETEIGQAVKLGILHGESRIVRRKCRG